MTTLRNVVRPRLLASAVLVPLVALSAIGAASIGAGASKPPSNATLQKELKTLASRAQAAKTTFKASYTYSSTGQSGSVTIEAKPPKSLFTSGGTSVIGTGSATYICSSEGGHLECLNEGSIANPLVGLEDFFSPTTAITSIRAAESYLGARASGYHVAFSNKSVAGQASTCVTVTGKGANAKYCVATKSGLVDYESANGNTFQLTSYSSNVSASDFNLPAGATVVTIPSAP